MRKGCWKTGLIMLTLFWVSSLKGQNFDNVGTLFECESITQLLQTFELSGTKSSSLQSMMRSIQRENLSSGFESQIVTELNKRPWRAESIKELEAEFQVIKGQFNAKIILEEEARRRMACELAKYLHRDYLLNYDVQTIFSPASVPFKFYSHIRENRLWRNLLTDEPIDLDEVAAEEANPSENENVQLIQPKNTGNLNLINILYWLFLIACGWLLLSLFLGIVFKNQRFTNPTTQQIFGILLLPFQLVKPMITADPLKDARLAGKNSTQYGTPVSESQLRSMIENQIAQTQQQETNVDPNQTVNEERIQKLESDLAYMRQQQEQASLFPEETKEPSNIDPEEQEDLLNTIEELQFRIEMLEKKIDLLNGHIERQQSLLEQQEPKEEQSINQAQILELINQELADYDLELDKRIKTLEAKNFQKPAPEIEETPPIEPQDTFSPGLSTMKETSPLIEIQRGDDDEGIEEEVSKVEQLELTPLPRSQGGLIWYAASPQKGLFYGRRLEPGFIPKQTVYKIYIDRTDPNRATFTLVDDEATVKLAMNIPDSYITPAMELHGPGKVAEAKHIGPIEAGTLSKEGDNWRIVKKGVLHYQ